MAAKISIAVSFNNCRLLESRKAYDIHWYSLVMIAMMGNEKYRAKRKFVPRRCWSHRECQNIMCYHVQVALFRLEARNSQMNILRRVSHPMLAVVELWSWALQYWALERLVWAYTFPPRMRARKNCEALEIKASPTFFFQCYFFFLSGTENITWAMVLILCEILFSVWESNEIRSEQLHFNSLYLLLTGKKKKKKKKNRKICFSAKTTNQE